ncbi:hypothetical protein [Oharaeibacter diazotrophicus]|uniref:Uncharacterized protein n=1 Tax=Oharaeibacter diazotrophicus TaxID=1920512 RepID=A0A4R6R9T1_9HYPH|nr:hypothetical protein [Oharaeibacter diazotrophicus]TDP82625.1 hypothetical protein EDD54_3894 [Oharaeibacter diazotrophicus]BBE72611.1 hypothetical protein OHA_1_02209 [Pleomorphomonas sp. SM30]GLS76645.1 hypothetical protein GCM10007904_19820 [Oharaeibacter diazotrophicus]
MTKTVAALFAALLAGTAAVAAAEMHPSVAGVHAYAPFAAISETAGSKHVVGWFESTGEACRMTLVVAERDDETLAVEPTRVAFTVAAADVAELATGAGSAIRVACTADADAVKVATFEPTAM